MRLVGLKFVNSLGHPVKVSAIKRSSDGKTDFVYYFDARPNWSGTNYIMMMKKQTFVKRYKKSLDEFRKI